MNFDSNDLFELHSSTLKQIKELNNKIEKISYEKEDSLHQLYFDIIEVIDTFEEAEKIIYKNKLNDLENSNKIINRYNTVLRKLQDIIHKHGITKVDFPDNKIIEGYCKVLETEPEPSKENDTILSIIKNGYTLGKEIIRHAEVIIVKN
jgi:molecular chaperone GrpE (heat shock protein)